MGDCYSYQVEQPVVSVYCPSPPYAGYNLEDWLSDKHTPSRKSAIERREERRALEGEQQFAVPTTIFERNVSPNLEKKPEQ